MEFRPATENEMADFQRIGSYVFASPLEDDQPSPVLPAWSQCAFDGDQMVATSAAYPFIVRLNGNTAPMHGVTMVGTEPAYRRRGLVRRMITDLLHRARDEGQVGSILLASMGAIYQRFGYGLASSLVRYEFDPRIAGFQQSIEAVGRSRRLDKETAFPAIRSVFRDFVKERNMMALRADPTWELMLRDLANGKAHCVVHYDADDVPDAYCVYSLKMIDHPDDAGPDQELAVQDFAWRNMNGYRGVWAYLLAHDLVGKIRWGNVPEDDPAPGLLLEPRCLNRRVADSLWFRPVDVAALLAARRYDVDGSVAIRIAEDDICPWNVQTYLLEVSGGEASVTVVDRDADCTCSINTLGSLVSGFSSASYLSQIGRMAVAEGVNSAVLDGLFSTRHRPHLSFGF